MQLRDTGTAEGHQVSPRARSMRRAGAITMATGVAAIIGLSVSGTATAANKDGPDSAPTVRSVATTAYSSPASADSAPE